MPFLLSHNSQITLKVKINDPHFQYQLRESQDAYFVQICGFSSISITSCCMDKPNFFEFWVKMAKITLKVTVNDPHFQYQPRVSQDTCLGQIWWLQLISDELSCGQSEFPRILCQNGINDLEVEGDVHFRYQLKVSYDTCLVQIWWFQLISVMSYQADKVKFTELTYGQTDRQTEAMTIPLRPERSRGKRQH